VFRPQRTLARTFQAVVRTLRSGRSRIVALVLAAVSAMEWEGPICTIRWPGCREYGDDCTGKKSDRKMHKMEGIPLTRCADLDNSNEMKQKEQKRLKMKTRAVPHSLPPRTPSSWCKCHPQMRVESTREMCMPFLPSARPGSNIRGNIRVPSRTFQPLRSYQASARRCGRRPGTNLVGNLDLPPKLRIRK
jgi:hypothetical protein